MNNTQSTSYKFDGFMLVMDGPALYHRGTFIDEGGKKMLQVLSVFLRRPNRLVSYEDVLNEVWSEDNFGVTSDYVNQYVRQLRKVMHRLEPGREYFENKKGRGYVFTGEVTAGDDDPKPISDSAGSSNRLNRVENHETVKDRSGWSWKYAYAGSGLVLVLILAFVYLNWLNLNDDEEVRRVVKESQMYESLVLYRSPHTFEENDLDKYWTAELDVNANYDRSRIRTAAKKMVDEGRRYGDESKCEQFDFQKVEIDASGDMAVVKTLEKWFVAVYNADGALLKNRTIGPYFVSYVLRNAEGRWLIEKSTTARVNRPTPRLSGIEAVSDMRGGEEFKIRVTGQDIEAETVNLQLIGPGCPESKPCKLPNSILREYSKLSETTLENVPLTLIAGDFSLVAHNGDSPASNPIQLTVP